MVARSVMKSAVLAVIFLLVLILLPTPMAAGGGIGIAPASLERADALRGNEYQWVVQVLNTTGGQLELSLGASGKTSQWVSFYDKDTPTTVIESITAPSGVATPFLVKITVPDDAANGTYTGSIYAETGTIGGEGGGQGIKLRASAIMTISVTGTEVLRGEVQRVNVSYAEVGLPVNIEVIFVNTGNVVATPTISVTIKKDDEVLDEFSHTETAVGVDSRETIEMEWDTTGCEVGEYGDYTALVEVSLGGETITSKEVPFAILPPGSSQAGEGKLLGLEYEGQPATGATLKIQATFENSGSDETQAKLVAEVYRDGNFIEALQSEEYTIAAGEQESLATYFKPDQSGDYDIKGYINYDGKKTEVREVSFTLGGGTGGGPPFNLFIPAVVVIVILIGVIAYMALRKRGKSA